MEANKTLAQLQKKLPDTAGAERFDLLKAILYTRGFKPVEVVEPYLEEMLQIASNLGLEERWCKALHFQGEFYRQTERISECRKVYHEALKVSEHLGRKMEYARSLRGIGESYHTNGEAVQAEIYFEKARAYCEEHKLHYEYIWALNCLGNVYNAKFLYDKAIKLLLEAIELSKTHKEEMLLAISYYNIVGSISDPQTRIEYLEKGVDGILAINSDNATIFLYSQLTSAYNGINDFEKSLQYGRVLLETAEKTQVVNHLWEAYHNVIIVLLKRVKLETDVESIDTLKEARSLVEKLLLVVNKSEREVNHLKASLQEAQVCFYEKEYSLANNILLRLDNKITKETNGDFDKIHKSVKHYLVQTQEVLGDFQSALKYYREYVGLADKIQNQEATTNANKLEAQYESKEKEAEVQRLQELETVKTRFFSQITHELRTPLTLIQGPAKEILVRSSDDHVRNQAHIIDRNANRLLNLVNQMLDLSKLEAGKMELKPSRGSLPEFVESIVAAFQTFAKQKEIQLEYKSDVKELMVLVDIDKLEKVLYNLLSNAFKFTEPEGKINVELELLEQFEGRQNIQITVTDTGKGITAASLPHIFNRFYQADNSFTREAEGTGIGLALVKEIIELMQGEITVQSTLGEGTVFQLQVPVPLASERIANSGSKAIDALPQRSASTTSIDIAQEPPSKKTPKGAPVLLLVEDNTDMHQFICSIFEEMYEILQAFNGEEGYEMALKHTPDIIVSDVMMPKKNGYELCDELKRDKRTSHIPLILLTAKTAMKSRIKGLEQGADAYLSKPFNAQELLLQTKNLLATRTKLQDQYQSMVLKGSEFEGSENRETIFLKAAIEVVEKHLNDESFNANHLSEELIMSSSQLYRKIKALTNTNVVEFIRNIRLSKAKVMLEKNLGNVSDVAYSVGMSPSYFSRVFTKKYGISPAGILKG